jgi:BTB/POZ domain
MGSVLSTQSKKVADLELRLQKAELALAFLRTKEGNCKTKYSSVDKAEGQDADDGDDDVDVIEDVIIFDVGGIKYKISRSTLEMHPNCILSKMVSRTWDQTKKVYFVDRDGQRFRYVLDFMRDGGKIHLPVTESRGAVAQELDYYGFNNVDEGEASSIIVGGVLDQTMIQNVHTNVFDEIDELEKKIERHEKEQEYMKNLTYVIKFAHTAFRRTSSLAVGKRATLEFKNTYIYQAFKDSVSKDLKKRLDDYGLKFVSSSVNKWHLHGQPFNVTVERVR